MLILRIAVTAGLLAPILAGCGDSGKAVAECRFSLKQASPGADIDNINEQIGIDAAGFMKTCMAAKGYGAKSAGEPGAETCGLLFGGMKAECYEKKSLL